MRTAEDLRKVAQQAEEALTVLQRGSLQTNNEVLRALVRALAAILRSEADDKDGGGKQQGEEVP